jgi:hypothetical protein
LSQASEARVLLGLSIAIDHPAFNISPQVLCAAARACKAWREAVQQCQACNTSVPLISSASPQLQQQTSFTDWLRKHAAMVSSIRIYTRTLQLRMREMRSSPDEESEPEQDCVGEALLQQRMQLSSELPRGSPAAAAAEPPPLTAASPIAAAAATAVVVGTLGAGSMACTQQQQQQQQQQCWRLASYSSDCFVSPATLAVLPAHSLTHLALDHARATPTGGAECRHFQQC